MTNIEIHNYKNLHCLAFSKAVVPNRFFSLDETLLHYFKNNGTLFCHETHHSEKLSKNIPLMADCSSLVLILENEALWNPRPCITEPKGSAEPTLATTAPKDN